MKRILPKRQERKLNMKKKKKACPSEPQALLIPKVQGHRVTTRLGVPGT